MEKQSDICIIGGCGHVGLPLGISFANKGFTVSIYDINKKSVDQVNSGVMPFVEHGAQEVLTKVINNNLYAHTDPAIISHSKVVVLIIGTPVDEFLNPKFSILKEFFDGHLEYFQEGQTLIMRSTVYPGTSEWVQRYFKSKNLKINVSFCPERIAEGKAMEELEKLPQIISAFDRKTLRQVETIFLKLTDTCIKIDPVQAELAKLFTNSWRYIQFAVANQFYMLANNYGTDFYQVYNAITHKYPRANGFPKAGFAAGPCLFKDTMQLASFSSNNFFLGHSAMLINEGFPKHIVNNLKSNYSLDKLSVGILGMAFKGDSDDKRSSLAYKLKKLLNFEAKKVLCSDVHIKDIGFVTIDALIKNSDVIIIGAPHSEYKTLSFPNDKVLVDIWGMENTSEVRL